MKKKVMVAMSGGVDSSVVAQLIKDSGYDCICTIMNLIYKGADTSADNCIIPDINDARKVASTLHIPFSVLDFTDVFHRNVVCPFVASYLAGQTPNPCVQ